MSDMYYVSLKKQKSSKKVTVNPEIKNKLNNWNKLDYVIFKYAEIKFKKFHQKYLNNQDGITEQHQFRRDMQKFNYKCHITEAEDRPDVNFQILQINSKACAAYGWGDVRFADVAREKQQHLQNSGEKIGFSSNTQNRGSVNSVANHQKGFKADLKTTPGKLNEQQLIEFHLQQAKVFGVKNCEKYFDDLFPDYKYTNANFKSHFIDLLKEKLGYSDDIKSELHML